MLIKYISILLLIFQMIPSSYGYPPQSLKLTDYEYQKYVRPQLKSILQDYQTLMLLLNPELKSLKDSFSEIKKIIKFQLELKDTCIQDQINGCLDQLKQIKKILSDLTKKTSEPLNLDKKEFLTLDERIRSKQFFANYQNSIIKAQLSIEDIFLERVVSKNENLYLKTIRHDLNNIVSEFYLFIHQASDNRFKNQFDNYWVYFIIPVYKFIIIQDSKKYFLENINELNLRWNTLNVVLTKRNKKVNAQVLTLANIMHNRWNNILKVTLDPNQY